MKNSKFTETYNKIIESITTDSAGVGSTQASTDQSTDSYAPGDARIPKVLGSKKKKTLIQKRTLPTGL